MIDDMTPREMYKMLKDARADIMLSGGRSQFVALKAKMPWLDINQERHHAYAGYDGMVELVQRNRQGAAQPGVGAGAPPGAVGNEAVGMFAERAHRSRLRSRRNERAMAKVSNPKKPARSIRSR